LTIEESSIARAAKAAIVEKVKPHCPIMMEIHPR
jgi:hypothetical protein